jgi:glycosyltransferase involved in cell wall biosynthesis
MKSPDIAILLPCFNEEAAIGPVVEGFRAALPYATVYVYDNGSTDGTVEKAAAAGAVVRHEPRRGKGSVVRRMFADIDADVYVMADGDGTYASDRAPQMVDKLVAENLDMVVGARTEEGERGRYRPGHRFGNRLFTATVTYLFGRQFTDILSGYRVFSRRFVKSFPPFSSGFEIETEITIHSLNLRLPVGEVATPYSARAEGSESKLSSFSDGLRILREIFWLLKENRPLFFFNWLFVALAAVALILAAPLFVTYAETGLVPRFPTAVLATGIMLLAFFSVSCGLILDSVSRARREIKLLHYLEFSSVRETLDP